MSKVSIKLSEIDKYIKALETLRDDLKELPNIVSKDIADSGLNYLTKQYSTLYSDPNITDIHTQIKKNDKGYVIRAYGNDVVYAEFGTGDMGEQNPHPDKSEYSLNDYNSGPFILDVMDVKNQDMLDKLKAEGITSGKFWSYNKGGEAHVTQGVPAGKQMFNTMNYLHDKAIPRIVKKRGEEINDKFIKSIER